MRLGRKQDETEFVTLDWLPRKCHLQVFVSILIKKKQETCQEAFSDLRSATRPEFVSRHDLAAFRVDLEGQQSSSKESEVGVEVVRRVVNGRPVDPVRHLVDLQEWGRLGPQFISADNFREKMKI